MPRRTECPIGQQVVDWLLSRKVLEPVRLTDITTALGITIPQFNHQTRHVIREGKILYLGKGRYCLGPNANSF
jgi:hypothetical protein